MENATKALIIAASMLIAIMVISIGVYLFATMSGYTTSAQKKIIDDRVVAFNNKFLIYDGKEDLTVHDIITVANYARQSNENYGLSENSRSDTNSYYVSVIWEKVNIETQQIKNESAETFLNKLLSENIKEDIESEEPKEYTPKKYRCEVKLNPNTARVYQVKFTETKKD